MPGVFPIGPGKATAQVTSQSCRERTNRSISSSPPDASERDDFVVDVVADVGATEIGDAGALAPMHGDLLLARTELRLVWRNGAAAAELDPGNPANARSAGEVQETSVDPVHVLAHLFEHEHVVAEVRLKGRAHEVTEDGEIEGGGGARGGSRRLEAFGRSVDEKRLRRSSSTQ